MLAAQTPPPPEALGSWLTVAVFVLGGVWLACQIYRHFRPAKPEKPEGERHITKTELDAALAAQGERLDETRKNVHELRGAIGIIATKVEVLTANVRMLKGALRKVLRQSEANTAGVVRLAALLEKRAGEAPSA